MTSESYTPTEEEIAKGEAHLTERQWKSSQGRLQAFLNLKNIFETQSISLENLRDIDLTVGCASEEFKKTYGQGVLEIKGSINGHEVSLVCRDSDAQNSFLEGTIGGMALSDEIGQEIIWKYKPVVEYLRIYNENVQQYRDEIRKEEERFNDRQRLASILKDIL